MKNCVIVLMVMGRFASEATIEAYDADALERIRWRCYDLKPPLLMQAAESFAGVPVRQVAATLRISKREAGRLRLRAFKDGLVENLPRLELSTCHGSITTGRLTCVMHTGFGHQGTK